MFEEPTVRPLLAVYFGASRQKNSRCNWLVVRVRMNGQNTDLVYRFGHGINSFQSIGVLDAARNL
jgi:hypothetical protein